jgi:hypothetical protein
MSQEAVRAYEFGDFRLEPAERQLRRHGRPVSLTPKAFDTLRVLVERGGHAVSKDELMAKVWPDTTVEEATLAQNIFAVRKVLGTGESAFDLSNDVRRRTPSLWAFYQVILAEIQLGRLDDAERTADTAARQFPGDVLLHPLRASIAALRGDAEGALEHVELTRRNRRSFGHYHHAQYDVACTFAVLGRTDEALAWLIDAARNGHPCYAFFERDPLLASLHGDARFAALMRELRAECDGYRQRYRALVRPRL